MSLTPGAIPSGEMGIREWARWCQAQGAVLRSNNNETVTGDWTVSGDWTFSGLLTIPEASVTAHEAALTILETQITDGALLARVAEAETISGAWTFTGTVKYDGLQYIAERAGAGADISGYGQLWVKDDSPNALYFTDDNGTDFLLSGRLSAYKNADTSRTSTAALADDTDIAGIVLDNDAFYKIEGYLSVSSASAVPDFKWTFNFSQAVQGQEYRWTEVDSGAGFSDDSGNLTDTFTLALNGTDTYDLHFIGFFRSNATTGGTLSLQWAQDVANGTATILHEGSWLQVTKLGAA